MFANFCLAFVKISQYFPHGERAYVGRWEMYARLCKDEEKIPWPIVN